MQLLIVLLAALLAGCTVPAMAPDLSLYDRFVLTALTDDEGRPLDTLGRWQLPLLLQYVGPERYRNEVERQLVQLGEISEKPVTLDAASPNVIVEISNRDTPSNCRARIYSEGKQVNGVPSWDSARVHIWSELDDSSIRQCIAQEMAHILGPLGDFDGLFGSRRDTVFASFGGASRLTEYDIAVLRILYDNRLFHGMPRDDVLTVLPEIINDLEAENAAQQ